MDRKTIVLLLLIVIAFVKLPGALTAMGNTTLKSKNEIKEVTR